MPQQDRSQKRQDLVGQRRFSRVSLSSRANEKSELQKENFAKRPDRINVPDPIQEETCTDVGSTFLYWEEDSFKTMQKHLLQFESKHIRRGTRFIDASTGWPTAEYSRGKATSNDKRRSAKRPVHYCLESTAIGFDFDTKVDEMGETDYDKGMVPFVTTPSLNIKMNGVRYISHHYNSPCEDESE